MKKKLVWSLLTAWTALSVPGITVAAEPEQCKTVTLSDPGWSDIGTTNGFATIVLQALGYQTDVKLLSVPIGFESLNNGQVDVFLGNWMPAQKAFVNQYKRNIDVVRTNLTGVKFTLAVPDYVYDAGVRSFADLHRFAKQFNRRIYGIAAGSPANQKLTEMVKTNDFSLGEWNVVASSEQGMLAQVTRTIKRHQFIVFLGWEPHPMNVKFKMKYLSGGDKYFGPNYGSSTVDTLTRQGYTQTCHNVGQLLKNMQFTLNMENTVMSMADAQGISPKAAAVKWLQHNPSVLSPWLKGVTTIDGKPGLAAVRSALHL